jgi:hypothetical protein
LSRPRIGNFTKAAGLLDLPEHRLRRLLAQAIRGVLGRIVAFEPLDEATRFGGGKGFVERRSRVRAEIVLNQNDFVRVGTMRAGQILERWA